jgi:nicotinate-nucleotide--dimethylbenzimidazole phosphoribosyltransferase
LILPDTLDGVRALLRDLPEPDPDACRAAAARQRQLIKPAGSLGRLEEIAIWLAGWQGRAMPDAERIWVLIFAGSHGVAAKGVSAYPTGVTRQMIASFHLGRAAVNQLCELYGLDLEIYPLDPERPTADFSEVPALTEPELLQAIGLGLTSVRRPCDLFCLGEMGIGNTTAAAAVAHGLYHGRPQAWTGSGTGIDAAQLAHKIAIVGAAVRLHRPECRDALDLLRRVGGRELAAIAGAVLGARLARIPVILDGYAATAAAAVLESLRPGALDHCLVAHQSAEPGHALLNDRLGKPPLFDLGLRLGEASGAALAAGVVRAAVACHRGMATFAEAGVDDRAG